MMKFSAVKNLDRYTRCASCKAMAVGILYLQVEPGKEIGGTSFCMRHLPTWKRRLLEQAKAEADS